MMEDGMILELIGAIWGALTSLPWYMAVLYVVGAVLQLLITLFLILIIPGALQALFTLDVAGIGICGFLWFEEGRIGGDLLIVLIALTVLLAGLFFMLCVTDDKYSGLAALFFGSLWEGFLNCLLVAGCVVFLLLPLFFLPRWKER